MADEELLMQDPEEEEVSSAWLVTSADMSLLLLCFFILLYSMSSVDTKKFSDTISSVSYAIQGKSEKVSTSKVTREEAGVLLDQAMMRRQIIESQRKVFAEIKTLQSTKGTEGLVGAHFENGLITLRLPGDVLFAPGQAELAPRGVQVISMLKDFFIKHPDQTINIKGFTDNVTPQGSRFKDNWELSAMRAVTVLRMLVQMGIPPNRLTATGLADLEPLFPNSTDENRARNRRVEFILEKRMTGG